jgi:DNA-binding transcriptional LysR family regulator
MELRHLRYFCALAEHQGFSRAARALNVSQSAISEQIADLELEIGVPLVLRSGHKIRLTSHGEIFLEEARKVLAAAVEATDMARRSLRGEVGTLRIGFFNGGTGPYFTRLIQEFRSRHPGVRLSLAEMIPPLQEKALVDGTLDIGFTRPLDSPFKQFLSVETVSLDPLMAVLPKDHPRANGPVDLRALASERFVLVARETSSALFDKIIAICSRSDFSPQIVNTGSVWSSVVLLVQAGEGISILPSNIQRYGVSDLVFCPLTQRETSIELVAAWCTERVNQIQSSFLQLMRDLRPQAVAAR